MEEHKKLISIVFVENVEALRKIIERTSINLQRAYHLLSRGSKSLSHRGFSFVGDCNSEKSARVPIPPMGGVILRRESIGRCTCFITETLSCCIEHKPIASGQYTSTIGTPFGSIFTSLPRTVLLYNMAVSIAAHNLEKSMGIL